MSISTWIGSRRRERIVGAIVITAALLIMLVARILANRALAEPLEAFRVLHSEFAHAVPALLNRALNRQLAETEGLGAVLGALTRDGGVSQGSLDSALHAMARDQRVRNVWLVSPDGFVRAHVGPSSDSGLSRDALRVMAQARRVAGPSPTLDSHLVFTSAAGVPGARLILIRETVADADVGVSLPAFSEAHSSKRAYLLREQDGEFFVVTALGTTGLAEVSNRIAVQNAPALWRSALTAGTMMSDYKEVNGERVYAYLSQLGGPGWTLVQRQSEAELMDGARRLSRQYLATGAILALLLIVTWLGVTRTQRLAMQGAVLREQRVAAQLHALQMELNPHFLFNTLNSIVAMVRMGNNKGADTMLIGLGELLRATLASDSAMEVTLARELALLRVYLDIERVRFADRLRIEFDVDDDARSCLVPSLVLQPLVENAIRHGIATIEGASLITIGAHIADRSLVLSVIDDGVGLPEGGAPLKLGIGLRNVQSRLEALYGASASRLDVARRETGGTRVEIHLPLRTEHAIA